MKMNEIGNGILSFSKKVIFKAKQKSPELCVIGAVVCGAGALVATWIAARKTDKALEEPKKMIETAKSMEIDENYTKADQKHDITLGYVKGAGAIVKLYGPAALLAGSAFACVFGSYKILTARNASLIALNGVLSKEFADYRKQVAEKYGKDEDYRLRIADKLEEKEEKTTDENGEEKTETALVPKKDIQKESLGRFFDESCPDWSKDPQYNLKILRNILRELNSKLHAERYLTLNDVYDAFHWERTQAGFEYGWALYPGEDEVYISFGDWLFDDAAIRRIIQMNERYYWLDFNCQKIDASRLPFRKV